MNADEYELRLEKALRDARFVEIMIGPDASVTLAFEVRRLRNTLERVRPMIDSWRDIAQQQRKLAEFWREQGEPFVWHAIRTDERAVLLETQALLLESILTTR